MDNIDDAETNAKISDSAYSNSCSNSQSRRSHSSKSTHSGSNSSGSSGYGGKASTSGSSNILGQPPKKEKEPKKKKLSQTEAKTTEAAPVEEPAQSPEPDPTFAAPKEESDNVVESTMTIAMPEKVNEELDTSTPEPSTAKEEALNALQPASSGENYVTSRPSSSSSTDGFFCVISMHDGVVMYTSASLTATLGFPKEIWVGRSFIDFVHPKDHKTFASLITNGLALPKLENSKQEKIPGHGLTSGSTMVCRIRRYRSLNTSFGVKDVMVTFVPFLLKFFFKDYSDEDVKVIYLVVQATPFFSAFKTPNELVPKPVPFLIKHAANGILEYIDPESIPYLGYLPQDVQDKNVLHLYHPDDLSYLRQIYGNIVKEGSCTSTRPFRLMAQNGDYIKVETDWSSVINPWSMKLEFVIAKHHIIEGPANPDVFQSPDTEKTGRVSEAEKYRIEAFRDSIVRVMNEVRTKPAETAKQQMGKRCQELASFMETLIEEMPRQDDDMKMEIQEISDRDLSYYEKDSVMLGGISPHHDSDSKSSIETPLSYNQLNYNENLQRYFDSQELLCYENCGGVDSSHDPEPKTLKPSSSKCFSPMAQNSGEFNEQSSNSSALAVYLSSPGPASSDCQYVKLTEDIINKHNSDMEKELVKMHRESRSSKGDREKASNESRQKKKEHLARCNASFQPTSIGDVSIERMHRKDLPRGVKRSRPQYDDAHAQKHHCPSPREPHSQRYPMAAPPPSNPSVTLTTTVAATQWQTPQNVNSFNMLGIGMAQQMQMLVPMPSSSLPAGVPTVPGNIGPPVASFPGPPSLPMPGTSAEPVPGTSAMAVSGTYGMSAMPASPALPALPVMTGMSGMYPVYYAPPVGQTPITSKEEAFPSTSGYQPFQAPMPPYMVHGHPISMMYGQPFVYSPINPSMYPVQQNLIAHETMQCSNSLNLITSNYEQSSDLVAGSSATSQCEKTKTRTSEECADRTDGESSYSSFYSSFFKTDSGSAEDSGDQKNKSADVKNRFWTKNMQGDDALSFQSSTEGASHLKSRFGKKLARRKMEAPWNEQVNLTSELVYKYQLVTKPMDEVLAADKQKITAMDQPSLVNEQLGQLYLDLQLQGVAARLTLEEGITSSSSSGEENTSNSVRVKRKREFSKLAIIHEENAPLPAPGSGLLVPDGPADEDITPTDYAVSQ